MSGGLFDYRDASLCDDITGVYPRIGLNNEEQPELAKAARTLNKLEDNDVSEMCYDLFCLLHSFDWYRSGDTVRSDYEADVKAFKEKWLISTICCKDCENWDTDWTSGGPIERHFCQILGLSTRDSFSCGRGEKRKDVP